MKKLLQSISVLECDVTVKFIVTSRPETHISTSPISNSHHNSILRLHTIDTNEVTSDIRLYIGDAFVSSALARPWYSEDDVNTLANISEGLFIFAYTIISYILQAQSVKGRKSRLRTAMSTVRDSKVALGPLDAMYELILACASDPVKAEPDELGTTLLVLACIVVSRSPLSSNALADLLGLDSDELRDSLKRLQSVLHMPEGTDQPGLRTLHASFDDYMLTQRRIVKSVADEMLARGCLRIIREKLHFNVANNPSSYEANATTPLKISLSLNYACMQWLYHVARATAPSTLDNDIEQLFCPQLLFWLEVMSALGQVWRAAAMLLYASSTVSRTFPLLPGFTHT